MEINSLQVTIAEKLREFNSNKIIDSVVDRLVDVEVSNRINICVQAVNLYEDLLVESKKIKPDIVSFNDDGSPANVLWSKQKIEEKNKMSDKITKINKTISRALEENNWKDLFDLVKSYGISNSDKSSSVK